MADFMPALFLQICLFIYVLDIGLLALYGLHSLLQTSLFVRYSRSDSPDLHDPSPSISQPLATAPATLATAPSDSVQEQLEQPLPSAEPSSQQAAVVPAVTIQLPIYNERHVTQRLIKAVAAMDWPFNRLQIQVLDDSTDETTALIQETLVELRATSNVVIEHCHRRDRTGFKAGALHQGLATATGEFIAIFDADFIPPADFLGRMMPTFQDAKIGCVQARWDHLNPETSLLTRTQAVGIDGHFVIEQQVRHHLGAFLNFNGTAGIWRRASLEQAGGWQGDTLTEDLDLSYRLQLNGWQIAYLPEVMVPAELPVQLYALKRQQFRWAKGSIQTALKLMRSLWTAPEPLWRKLLASFHLTQYMVHPLMLLNLLLIWPVLQSHTVLLSLTPFVTVAAIGPPLMYWATMGYQGISWPMRIRRLGSLLALGTGLSINNSWAALQAVLGIDSEFKRTPKFSIIDSSNLDSSTLNHSNPTRSSLWQSSSYVLSGSGLIWIEAVLSLYASFLVAYSITMRQWGILPWLVLYASGYALVVSLTIVQSAACHKLQRNLMRRR